jgi:putative ABC transport system permease protein
MKALGASGRRVFSIYLTQVLLLALIGGAIGVTFGAILPFVIYWTFGAIIPLPIVQAVHTGELVLALVYGLITAVFFTLWPLGRALMSGRGIVPRRVAPQSHLPRKRYVALTVIALFVLAAFVVLLAYDRRVAVIYVATAAGIFVLLRAVAALMMDLARRAPRAQATGLRMAIANIHRPGALTPTIVLSLGLGIALLVTVIEIDGNLQRQFSNELPAKAPSFYFLTSPPIRSSASMLLHAQAPAAKLEEVPMLRGRIVSAGGTPVENIKPREDAAWVLQSDRGLTYGNEIPPGRGWSRTMVGA